LKSGRIEYEHLQCGKIWNTNPPERIWITNPNIKCSRITNPPEQVISTAISRYTAYRMGYELLMLNGLLTYCGLWLTRKVG